MDISGTDLARRLGPMLNYSSDSNPSLPKRIGLGVLTGTIALAAVLVLRKVPQPMADAQTPPAKK